jgi:uroporphyrinogen-III synthase
VLHPGALEPAGELLTPLAAAGLTARRLALYESVPRAPAAATLAEFDSLEAVLLHSPRAARILAGLLAEHPAPGLRALCLSAAVAAPLAGLEPASVLGPVAFAPRPTETDLLDLLDR